MVHDPTTAVRRLGRIVQFLAMVAHLPLGAVRHHDRAAALRLVRDLPAWADLADPERRKALARHRTPLARAVRRTVPDDDEFALVAYRQGIG